MRAALEMEIKIIEQRLDKLFMKNFSFIHLQHSSGVASVLAYLLLVRLAQVHVHPEPGLILHGEQEDIHRSAVRV